MGTINPVRIRLRFPDVDTFVAKFAPNVTRGGLFLASKNIQPVGEIISFEIQLMSGAVALSGQGKVTWVKEFNAAEPNRPYGMGVQFVSVDPASRPVLARILRAKETGGAGPRGVTGPQPTLAASGLAPANGRAAAAPVDTSVDLAGEYGISDAAMKKAMERRRMSVARVDGKVDDDLSDLLKPEPQETPTLAQALAELPRLVDPQNSRRRAAGGFRGLDPSGPIAAPVDVSDSGRVGSGPVAQSSVDELASERTNQVDDETPMMAADGAVTTPSPSSGSRRSRRRRS
ncbi:MAG TPA: PilZ domain-containing protein [Polyangia bacterium]|nr:PilZ domain-containing protein [Polyangia bacterium]